VSFVPFASFVFQTPLHNRDLLLRQPVQLVGDLVNRIPN
jgi:hypothetical protein